LREAFERDGAFTVVGEASNVEQSVRLAAELEPDVTVMDVNLPDGSGLDAARRLRADHPDMGIVMLTMYNDDDHLFAALDVKASAFVPKSASTDDVLSAARHAAAAPHSFSAADLPDAMHRRMNPSKPKLSVREQSVLELLSEGLTVPVIAKRLYISESTTKSYVSKMYEKLGVGNRSQALVEAVRLGLIRVNS
jgi:DNA-binding NarL/FixJ family response regulator